MQNKTPEPVKSASIPGAVCLRCYASNSGGSALVSVSLEDSVSAAQKSAHKKWQEIRSRYNWMSYRVMVGDALVASGRISSNFNPNLPGIPCSEQLP